MKKLFSAVAGAAIAATVTVSSALAQTAPPPVLPALPAAGDTPGNVGNKLKVNLKKALADGAVCTIGGVALDSVDGLDSSFLEKVADTIFCNGIAMAIPVPGLGGFFGLVSNYTICCKKTAIVPRLLRPEGFRCTLDVLWVAGCPEYLLVNGTKAQKKALRTSTSPYVVAARLRLATTQ